MCYYIKYRAVLFFLLIAITISACKKTKYLLFSNENNGIYYFVPYLVDTIPTAYFGFMDGDTTLQVYLKLVGLTANVSRHYQINILSTDVNDAIHGTDYDISGTYSIAANSYIDSLSIHLTNKHLDTLSSDKSITLQIIPNENFDTIISPIELTDIINSYTFNMPSSNRLKIRITYTAPKPPFWEKYVQYLGTYSQRKMKTFLKVGNQKLAFLMSTYYMFYYYNNSMLSAIYDLQNYLQAMADADSPVLDEDGTPMQLGPSALIHY